MTTTKPSTLSLTHSRTYLLSTLFVIGNILLPQLCHLIPQGGLIFLPIYFFTLIAAYRYGSTVGLLTALLSPLANSLFFGMPPVSALPAIMIKSVSLALIASLVAKRRPKVTLTALLIVILGYQLVGMTFEFALGLYLWHSAADAIVYALQDVRIGLPGLLLQLLLGYFLIKKIR